MAECVAKLKMDRALLLVWLEALPQAGGFLCELTATNHVCFSQESHGTIIYRSIASIPVDVGIG